MLLLGREVEVSGEAMDPVADVPKSGDPVAGAPESGVPVVV